MSRSGILQVERAVGHLTPGELAGYVDRALDEHERRAAEEHLAECAECRAEAVAIKRATEGLESQQIVHASSAGRTSAPRHTQWRAVVVAGALAASLATILVVRNSTAPVSRRDEVRASNTVSGNRQAIDVVSPVDGSAISEHGASFRWHAMDTDSYRFTLLTESGDPVWSSETADTTVTLPPSVSLRRDSAYFYRVDALRDGVAATSGVLSVHVAP